jgi:hypothetical protein
MKATQQYKELHNVEIMKEKQNELDDTRIYEILSKYSTWFMKNNIEEFQMFSKFWNQQYTTNYRSLSTNYLQQE